MMSANSYLHHAVEQVVRIARDIELDMDEGMDHKGAYLASVHEDFKNRVTDLLADPNSVEWDLHEDDLIDKAMDNDPERQTSMHFESLAQ